MRTAVMIVRVEIYRMNEAAGAAAVFAEITAGIGVQELYGTACVLDDYQVLFYRGALLRLADYLRKRGRVARRPWRPWRL